MTARSIFLIVVAVGGIFVLIGREPDAATLRKGAWSMVLTPAVYFVLLIVVEASGSFAGDDRAFMNSFLESSRQGSIGGVIVYGVLVFLARKPRPTRPAPLPDDAPGWKLAAVIGGATAIVIALFVLAYYLVR